MLQCFSASTRDAGLGAGRLHLVWWPSSTQQQVSWRKRCVKAQLDDRGSYRHRGTGKDLWRRKQRGGFSLVIRNEEGERRKLLPMRDIGKLDGMHKQKYCWLPCQTNR